MRVFAVVLISGVLISGLFLTCGAQEDPDPNYVLSLSSPSGPPGSFVEVSVFLDFPNGENAAAVSVGVCASPGDSSLVGNPCGGSENQCFASGIIVPGPALAATNGGQGPTYFTPQTFSIPSDGWGVFAGVDTFGGVGTLPPQEQAEILIARYELHGPVGSTSELTFCENFDPYYFSVAVYLPGGDSVIPETHGGSIEIQEKSFIRGDVDSDGAFNGVLDGLFLLNSAFIPGSPNPVCTESADVDGNGVMHGLVDALFALECQFLPGSSCPPMPFPECGVDPDFGNTLGCFVNLGCP